MSTPTFVVGFILILLGGSLRFVRRIPERWRRVLEILTLIAGLALLSPPGLLPELLHYRPFTDSVRDLGLITVIGLLAILIRRLAGVSGQDGGSYLRSERERSESEPQNGRDTPISDTHTDPLSTSKAPVNLGEKHSSVIVTLVHGTTQPGWLSYLGLGSSKREQHDWVCPESKFAAELLRNSPPGIQIRSFFWAGENSHSSRTEAARKLQAHVQRLSAEFPDAEQICVGHSHGGSVIHYALGDPHIERSLLGYAFLSTPFLDFKPRVYGPLDSTEFVLVALAIAFTLVPTYVVTFALGWSLFSFRPLLLESFLMIPFAIFSRTYRARISKRRRHAEEFLGAIPTPHYTPEKAIFVRTPGDEASNGLGIVYLLAWVQIRSQVSAERFVKQLEERQAKLKPGGIGNFGRLLAAIVVLNSTAVWSAVSAFLCSKAFSLAFGADVSKHTPFLQVTTEPTPPGKWIVHQLYPYNATAASLAHSSYAHPDVPALLGSWLGTLITNKDRQALSAST